MTATGLFTGLSVHFQRKCALLNCQCLMISSVFSCSFLLRVLFLQNEYRPNLHKYKWVTSIFQILLCMNNGVLKSNTRTNLNIITSIRNFAAIYIEYFIYKKSAGRIFFIYVKTRDLMNRQRI